MSAPSRWSFPRRRRRRRWAPGRCSMPTRCWPPPDCSQPLSQRRGPLRRGSRGPPNRAYLKLWEALTLLGRRPGPGELCLDLGASPGGWTWVLAKLGARVIAVDKAPLDPRSRRCPASSSARRAPSPSSRPRSGPVDWLFSRHRLLSGAAAGAGRALAGGGPGAQLRLHDQVPGRDRSRRRRGASPPSPARACCICTTTSMS